MSASDTPTSWWQLPLLVVALVGVEWIVERQSTSAARDAALRAADAAAAATELRLADLGPLEARRGQWLANGRPVDAGRLSGIGGFDVALAVDAGACPLPSAERVVLVERRTASGYAYDGRQWRVVRCDPVRDRHGQVAGVLAVSAPAAGFAGNPWRVRTVLVPALAGLFTAAAVGWWQLRRARLEAHQLRLAAAAHATRTDASAALVVRRAEEIDAARADAEAARADAEAANEAKRVFLANLSAAVRARLDEVSSTASHLREQLTPELQRELDPILDAADQLSATVTEVSDLTKIEAGELTTDLGRFDVRELLEELVDAFRARAGANGNTLKFEVDPHVSDLTADRARVRQMLWNLLSNATKYTEGGEIVLSAFQVRDTDDDPERIGFSVVDTGVGMDEDALATAFDAFVQHDRSGSGTGIGLTLVRALAEQMGGTVAAESSPGVGSEFTVIVPRDPRRQ
ncbi:MAG: HAMP domain-containing sensor histidine kinase [Myxococcota bacterium]